MRSRLARIIIAAIILCAPGSGIADAAEIAGVHFVDSHVVDESTLTLRGTGLLRYLVFIKAYVAAFYLEPGVPSEAALSDVARRLEIEYFHSIKAEDFVFSTNTLIPDNVDADAAARLRPRIDRINELYEDVRPGDRYSLTYVPGRGTELALNGVSKGMVEGADFASAIFSIWLGPRPIDRSLKASLLGEE